MCAPAEIDPASASQIRTTVRLKILRVGGCAKSVRADIAKGLQRSRFSVQLGTACTELCMPRALN